jgi:glycoside/pentoside/hexuronide:cation symporter, GPH family
VVAVSPGPRLTRGTHLGYALGSIGTAAFGTVPGLLLLYYLTDELGVAAGIAGLVVFAPKAWDVVLNPWIGSRSDRTESRWGPRRPWMLAGGLALPPLFVLVFAGPGTPPGLAAAWVAVAFSLPSRARPPAGWRRCSPISPMPHARPPRSRGRSPTPIWSPRRRSSTQRP